MDESSGQTGGPHGSPADTDAAPLAPARTACERAGRLPGPTARFAQLFPCGTRPLAPGTARLLRALSAD